MLQRDDSFNQLMSLMRNGSEDAIREFLKRYGHHVRRIIRRKLHPKLRSRFDSMDFMQDVWTAFFTTGKPSQDFAQPNELIAYLADMACKRMMDAFRRQVQSQKRDLNREISLEQEESRAGHPLISGQPGPARVARAKEQWQRLLEQFPEFYRPVVTLYGQGYTYKEIAEKLGFSERTVRRVIYKLTHRTGSSHT